MKYIIKIAGRGYYAGPSEKYHDMFNTTLGGALYARRFDDPEEAQKVAKPLERGGYEVSIETIDDIPTMPKNKDDLKRWLEWHRDVEGHFKNMSFPLNGHTIQTKYDNRYYIAVDGVEYDISANVGTDHVISKIFD